MIKIDTAYFDFRMGNEGFAHRLYGQWDSFCRVAFEKVVDDVLSKYDTEREVLQFEAVTLELGILPEAEFYEKFPVLLAERLHDFFTAYLLYGNDGASVAGNAAVDDKIAEWLVEYLLYGNLCWKVPDEYRNLSYLLGRAITLTDSKLASSLRFYGGSLVLRERLVLQFTDEELERVVAAVEPSDCFFVNGYVRFLRSVHKRRKRPEVAGGDYRNVVWLLVFAYLLHDGKDFFSRKQFVYRTLSGLAARYNMHYPDLLNLVTSGIHRMIAGQVVNRELLQILRELRQEQQQGKMADEMGALCDLAIKTPEDVPVDGVAKIRLLLSREETCRRLLRPLKEEEIYRFVRLVVPAESDFVISYARLLEQGREQDMFEGKAGSEFRLLKWEFLFRVLLNDPGSLFDRKRFVYTVLSQLAAHYNLDVMSLLEYLRSDVAGLPEWLPEILRTLFTEQQEKQPLRLIEAAAYRELTTVERTRLIRLLSHPHSCRLLLGRLPETHIYRLAEIVCPAESPFIVAYAQALERQKERGMFEGKAGTDFRVVKWEFIFLVVMNSVFNRKQFVHSVLQQLAVHYNLNTVELLDYFYGSFTGDDCPAPQWLTMLIRELRTEFADGREPGSLLEVRERQYKQLRFVGDFMLTGVSRFTTGDAHMVFLRLCREMPDEIRLIAEHFKKGYAAVQLPAAPGASRFYAAFLLWVVRYYGLCFSGCASFVSFLEFVETGKTVVSALLLRQLAYYCLVGDTVNFQRVLERVMEKKQIAGDEDNALLTAGRQETEELAAGLNAVLFCGLIAGEKRQEVLRALETYPQKISLFWEKGELDEQELFAWLAGDKVLQTVWVSRIGGGALRAAANEWLELQQSLGFRLDERLCWEWLAGLTAKRYVNLSQAEILARLWKKFRQHLAKEQYRLLKETVLAQAQRLTLWKKALTDVEGGQAVMPEVQRVEQENENPRFYIRNAGLVLLSPWYARLFSMLGLVQDGKTFVDREAQVKAVFVLQHLLSEEKEWPEFDLMLNKLLTGYMQGKPLPRNVELNGQERQTLGSMLAGVKQNWEKMEHTTLQGFRDSFLLREGVLQEREEYWYLRVESRTYDVLLDTLPWGFAPVKYPWMDKPLLVEWR